MRSTIAIIFLTLTTAQAQTAPKPVQTTSSKPTAADAEKFVADAEKQLSILD